MPLHHPPGHAQVDFGEAVMEVGGRREKVAFFCLILPHSNLWFVNSPLKKAAIDRVFTDGETYRDEAVSPSSETMRTI